MLSRSRCTTSSPFSKGMTVLSAAVAPTRPTLGVANSLNVSTNLMPTTTASCMTTSSRSFHTTPALFQSSSGGRQWTDVDSADIMSRGRVSNFLNRTGTKNALTIETTKITLGKKSVVFQSQIRLQLPKPHGTKLAMGCSNSPKDAEIVAIMHAERIIDSCGLHLYRLGRTQEKHANECIENGRWAPMPNEPEGKCDPNYPDGATPAPLRFLPSALCELLEAEEASTTKDAEATVTNPDGTTRPATLGDMQRPSTSLVSTGGTDGRSNVVVHAKSMGGFSSGRSGDKGLNLEAGLPIDECEAGAYDMVDATDTIISGHADTLQYTYAFESKCLKRIKDWCTNNGNLVAMAKASPNAGDMGIYATKAAAHIPPPTKNFDAALKVSQVDNPSSSAEGRLFLAELSLSPFLPHGLDSLPNNTPAKASPSIQDPTVEIPTFGGKKRSIIAQGKARERQIAIVLATMHAELLLDFYGVPVFNSPSQVQKQRGHMEHVIKYGRGVGKSSGEPVQSSTEIGKDVLNEEEAAAKEAEDSASESDKKLESPPQPTPTLTPAGPVKPPRPLKARATIKEARAYPQGIKWFRYMSQDEVFVQCNTHYADRFCRGLVSCSPSDEVMEAAMAEFDQLTYKVAFTRPTERMFAGRNDQHEFLTENVKRKEKPTNVLDKRFVYQLQGDYIRSSVSCPVEVPEPREYVVSNKRFTSTTLWLGGVGVGRTVQQSQALACLHALSAFKANGIVCSASESGFYTPMQAPYHPMAHMLPGFRVDGPENRPLPLAQDILQVSQLHIDHFRDWHESITDIGVEDSHRRQPFAQYLRNQHGWALGAELFFEHFHSMKWNLGGKWRSVMYFVGFQPLRLPSHLGGYRILAVGLGKTKRDADRAVVLHAMEILKEFDLANQTGGGELPAELAGQTEMNREARRHPDRARWLREEELLSQVPLPQAVSERIPKPYMHPSFRGYLNEVQHKDVKQSMKTSMGIRDKKKQKMNA